MGWQFGLLGSGPKKGIVVVDIPTGNRLKSKPSSLRIIAGKGELSQLITFYKNPITQLKAKVALINLPLALGISIWSFGNIPALQSSKSTLNTSIQTSAGCNFHLTNPHPIPKSHEEFYVITPTDNPFGV